MLFLGWRGTRGEECQDGEKSLGRKRCAARWRANFIGCRALSRTFPMPHHYHAQSSCGFQRKRNVFFYDWRAQKKPHPHWHDMFRTPMCHLHSFRTQITLDCSQDWASHYLNSQSNHRLIQLIFIASPEQVRSILHYRQDSKGILRPRLSRAQRRVPDLQL